MRLFVLRSILVASDLGESSSAAVRTGTQLARLTGAPLHLVHVAAAPGRDGEERLRDHARRAAPGAPEATSAHVTAGPPGAAIAAYAAQVGADVIVFGPHRRNGPRPALGSTASEVVDAAACPCLIVAGELPLPLERVMAPVDLSEASGGSLAVALTWASALRRPDRESELTILRVETSEDDQSAAAGLDPVVERVRAWAAGAARVRVRDVRVASEDPASEILRRADADAADLLVIGTGAAAAGRESAERRVGRVSSAVIRDTPRPVLLIPPAVWRSQDIA